MHGYAGSALIAGPALIADAPVVARSLVDGGPQPAPVGPTIDPGLLGPVAVAGFDAEPAGTTVRAAAFAVEPAPRSATVPRFAPIAGATTVAASWFGPGLWGNRTACGLTLTAELSGVAHRTLPCGSLVTLRSGSSIVRVPVIDRGPFVYAREFDLTYATRVALGCPDICHLSWLR